MLKKKLLLVLGSCLCMLQGFSQEGREEAVEMVEHSRNFLGTITHHDPIVMEHFELFQTMVVSAHQKEKSLTLEEVQQIFSALQFAAEKHRFQTRKNQEKTAYISHPIGVAYYLLNQGKVRNAPMIMAALLHDTVEDTQTSFEELNQHFGRVVMGYVQEVSDDKSLSQEERKRLQIIDAPHHSKEAAQIEMADKMYNVLDLLHNPPPEWSQLRKDRYFEWTQSVIDRLPSQVNPSLQAAVQEVINTYWEQQRQGTSQ